MGTMDQSDHQKMGSGGKVKNLSVSKLSSGTIRDLPSTITNAPTASSCPPCQILASGGGFLSRAYWWNSTLGLTLDTVSVVITQYNNTAITGRTTVYGDLKSVQAITVSEAVDIQYSIGAQQYPGQPSITFANGTDGQADPTRSIPYPTPYLGAAGYMYVEMTTSDAGCPANAIFDEEKKCGCPMATAQLIDYARDIAKNSEFDLKQTYYSVFPTVNAPDWRSIMNDQYNSFDPVPFSKFVATLSPRPPKFESCYFPVAFVGPPALKVPVSALTATTTATIQGTQSYGWTAATPALTASTVIPAETSKAEADRLGGSDNIPPEASDPLSSPAAGESIDTHDEGNPNVVNSVSGTTTVDATYPGNPASDEPQLPTPAKGSTVSFAHESAIADIYVPVVQADTASSPGQIAEGNIGRQPVLTFGGSAHTMDGPSGFVLGDQTLAPGRTITISGSVVSLPTSGSIAIVNGATQTLAYAPVLSLGGSTHTMDGSLGFVLDGQTLTKGGAITVSGSVVSLPTGGSIAIVDGATQTLAHAPVTAVADTNQPVLTLGGSTYTMDRSSGFVLDGQTLNKGGAITVSGHGVSLPSSGSIAIVNGATQTLSHASITAVAEGDAMSSAPSFVVMDQSVVSLLGSTLTMDGSSNLILGDTTIMRGGVFTTSGHTVSLPSSEAAIVIDGVTHTLSGAVATPGAEPLTAHTVGSHLTTVSGFATVIDGSTLALSGSIPSSTPPVGAPGTKSSTGNVQGPLDSAQTASGTADLSSNNGGGDGVPFTGSGARFMPVESFKQAEKAPTI
ncbi:MAG: hypothetical protein Q9222_002761 [Ikaeria aurantiellina]